LWLNGPQLAPTTGPTRATLGTIPNGEAGAVATLRRMRQLVRDAVRDANQHIRETALKIVDSAGYVDQVRRLQSFVQDNIRYIHDPPDVELIQTPQYTLQQRAGDCDDQATLLAALLMALGHPVQFVAVGMNGQALSHVLVQTLIGQKWVSAETILKKPLGWNPPGVTSHYILKV
jgi:transglutaminase-like putative cysteine protease